MADTGAERQRRRRAHQRGDHSLCSPDRCRPESVTVTPVTASRVTAVTGLGIRGQRLWDRLNSPDGPPLTPAEAVLLEEACRLADRLDTLDRILRGDADAWMRFKVDESGSEVTVVVNNVLAEARQQQTALKQLLAELRQSRGGTAAPRRGMGGQRRTSGTGARAAGKGGGVVADLASWVAERSQGSAG